MRRKFEPRWLAAAVAACAAIMLTIAGCTAPEPTEPTPSASPTTPEPDPTTTSPQPKPMAWGPTKAELKAAIETASSMSDEEVAGQVILARYPGTDPSQAAATLRRYHLGGLVLFSDNVSSLDQVRKTGEAIQAAQTDMHRSWPAIFATDNEGGLVQRLNSEVGPWTSFPEFMAAGAADDYQTVHDATRAMAIELRASGLNMNFAPITDVTIGAKDAAIGTRSAGGIPKRVAHTVSAAVKGFTDGGVASSLKHFPGHGSLTVDSHSGLPHQRASAATLAKRDLVPFSAGIKAGAGMVMVGHIAVEAWDGDTPASLSKVAYTKLRKQLGFRGVAVTDALDMGALTENYKPGQISVKALNAGADLLLSPGDVGTAHDAIVAALKDGSLDRERINDAAGHVIALMRWQAQSAEASGPVAPEDASSGRAASLALSRAAITQVAGKCGGPLVKTRIHVHGGSKQDWDLFVAAMKKAGIEVVPLEQDADTEVRLITSATPSGGADVAIALDGPWQLSSVKAPVKLAAFGHTSETFAALADVLTGKAAAKGTLPIKVKSLPESSC